MPIFRKAFLLPFLLSCGFIALSWVFSPPKTAVMIDSPPILYAADNLITSRTFSPVRDWVNKKKHRRNKTILPSRYISPVLPFMVAGYAMLDGGFRQALSCFVASGNKCQQLDLLSRFLWIQSFFVIGGAMAAFYLAYVLSKSWDIAFLTMVLILFDSQLVKFGQFFKPFVYEYFFIYASLVFLVLMSDKKNYFYGVLAGLFFGLAALTQSHYLFGIVLSVIVIIVMLLLNREWKWHQSLAAGSALAFGLFVFAGSWSLRNYYLFGDFWLNPHEFAKDLSDRIGFNAMNMTESFQAVLYYLPSYFGELGGQFISAELKHKLGLYSPGTYVSEGAHLLETVVTEQRDASLWASMLGFQHIIPVWSHHLMTSLPLFIKSLSGGGSFVVMIGIFFMPRLFKIHFRREQLFGLLILAAVFLCFALTFALFTPAVKWFVMPLIFIYCYAIAYVAGSL